MRNALSRRAFAFAGGFSALATAGLAGASAAIGAESADARLLDLVNQVIAADQRRDQYDQEADRAFDRIESVKIPEALEHRRDIDFPYICSDENRCASYRLSLESPWRSIYEDPDALTLWAQRWLGGDGASLDPRFFTAAHHQRMREIGAAFEQWNRARAQAEAAAGYDVPEAASKRESELIDGLLRQIALCPANTSEGLAAKVRASRVARAFFPGDIRELEDMIDGGQADWSKAFTTSLFADAARLGGRDTATTERNAA